MADPMTVPETYGYGITETARTNLHATLEGMDAREQVIMLTEFLRVISHILMDVSMVIQNSVDAQNDEVNVEVEESSLVQKDAAKKVSRADGHKRKPAAGQNMEESNKKSKALEPAKAAKLLDSVRTGSVASALGTRLETMVRTLLAAMDKMKVNEARACAQVFFNRLQVLYQGGLQAEMTPTWPADAQSFAAGLVACGAEVGQPDPELTGQDKYFVTHWWTMVLPLLPAGARPIKMAMGGGYVDGSSYGTAGRQGSKLAGCCPSTNGWTSGGS